MSSNKYKIFKAIFNKKWRVEIKYKRREIILKGIADGFFLVTG